MSNRTIFRKWVYRTLAICIGLLAVEVILDVGRFVSPRIDYHLSPQWSRARISDEVLLFRMSPYYAGNDEWGFRNPKVPEQCDILTIGDSNTYGYAATPDNTWPQQLERLSGRSTYNMSCGGYGFCQYEVLLDRGLKLKPSVVILGLTVGNDFSETYSVVYRAAANCPAKRFKNNDVAWLTTLEQADKAASFGNAALDIQDPAGPTGIHRWMSSNSSLYALAREMRFRIVSKEYFSPFREDEPPQDAFDLCLQRPGRMAYDVQPQLRTVFLDPDLMRRRLVSSDPRVQEGKRISEAILLSMRAKALESNARFVVVLFPTKNMVYRDLMAHSPQRQLESYFRLVETEQAITESIEQFLRVNEIGFVNPTSALRICLLHNQRPYPESDDQHLNRIGYGAIAEAILPWVDKSNDGM